MKRIVLFLLIGLSCLAFAAPKEITYLHTGKNPAEIGYAESQLAKDFPGWTVKPMIVDMSTGSTLTMDAMLAAGKAPNVYEDSMVRISKYITPEFALPLNGLVRDLKQYLDFSSFTRNGKVLAIPGPAGSQGICLNLDILDEIGYTVPDNWTVDDFLKMAAMVKAKYSGKKWATGMFAANQSGDYLIQNWFPAFGAQFFKAGDYTKSTIRATGGEKVYSFFQLLAKEGYIPPNSDVLTDDDYAIQWSSQQLVATAFFPGWLDPYWKTAIDQGIIKAPFRVKFVPFPRGPGVKAVGTYTNGAAIVVRKTGTEADKVAARFAEYLNSPVNQELETVNPILPSRKDARIMSTMPALGEVLAIVKKGGIYESGITSPKFPAIRACQFPILQKVLTFKMTPAEAALAYEKAVNEALK